MSSMPAARLLPPRLLPRTASLLPWGWLAPVAGAVSALLATAYTIVVRAGVTAGSPLSWAVSEAMLVLVVRAALLPLVVRQVQAARAAARARPALTLIRERYAGRTDLESLRARAEEVRAARIEHGMRGTGMLPALAQAPVLLALYRVLSDVGTGDSSLPAGVVAAARAAQAAVDAVPGLGVALVVATAAVMFATSRWLTLPNTPPPDDPDSPLGAAMVRTQGLMPWISAGGVLMVGFALPVGLVWYWLVSACWTAAQQAAVARWAPTPGSAAARRREFG